MSSLIQCISEGDAQSLLLLEQGTDNSLANNKISGWSKLKAYAEDKISD